MEIIRTHAYEASLRRLAKVGATDSDIESMEREIAVNPDVGDVIAGTGGLRKVRFGFGHSGKRGGGRTIYYALTAAGVVYLLVAYAKVDKSDLTSAEKRMFKALIKELTDD